MEVVDGETRPFPLFSKAKPKHELQPQIPTQLKPTTTTHPTPDVEADDSDANPASTIVAEKDGSDDVDDAAVATFAGLGLSEWLVDSCHSLGMKRSTAVQQRCIPRALVGEDVLNIAETSSGKTAMFALPILHPVGEDPFGVTALALSPMPEQS